MPATATAEPTTGSVTFQMYAHELHQILADGSVCVEPKSPLPAIDGVRIFVDGGSGFAESTDRYTIGRRYFQVSNRTDFDQTGTVDVFLEMADVKRFLKIWGARDNSLVSVTINGEGVDTRSGSLGVHATVRQDSEDDYRSYPNTDRLWDGFESKPQEVGSLGLDLLVRFGKVAHSRGAAVTIEMGGVPKLPTGVFGSPQPWRLSIGRDDQDGPVFQGLIMPTRLPEGEQR